MYSKQNRRSLRHYFIDRDIQLKILTTNLFHFFAITFIIIALIIAPVVNKMFQSFDSETQYQAATLFLSILERIMPVLGVIFLFFILHQLMITHHFCGPIKNFAETFRKTAAGDLTRKIKIRHTDFLRDDAQLVNDMLDSLSQSFHTVQQEHRHLVSALEEVAAGSDGAQEHSDAARAIAEARKRAGVISELLEKFTC